MSNHTVVDTETSSIGSGHIQSHGYTNEGLKTVFGTSQNINLFFKGWTTTSYKEYLGACFAIVLLGLAYEGLKALKHLVVIKQRKCHKSSIIILTMHKVKYRHSTFRIKKVGLHFLQTLIHACQTFLGLLLMLAFMTVNTYICVAVILGFSLGHLVFGWVPIVTADREY